MPHPAGGPNFDPLRRQRFLGFAGDWRLNRLRGMYRVDGSNPPWNGSGGGRRVRSSQCLQGLAHVLFILCTGGEEKPMKTALITGVTGAMILSGFAYASPLTGMTMELYSSGTYGNTYRLYAQLTEGARIDAVYGNSVTSLSIAPGDGLSFYQNALGGNTSKNINSAFFAVAPSVEWDSYVSIGALYQDGTPFDSNNLNDIGIDWASFEGGGALETDNGSWFVTPDDAQGGEYLGSVFIGQFTVAGGSGVGAEDVVGSVNLQGKTAGGDTWNELGATWVPAPGALALLGFAGLAGRRRRRA